MTASEVVDHIRRGSYIAENPEELVRELIRQIGDDPRREGLVETPRRVLRSYAELFSGYHQDPASLFKTFSKDGYDEMIICKDIEFCSSCEHHMLPFFGSAHIAYLPAERIIGISKLSRLMEIFSRRLQIQERLTTQITGTLDKHLQPLGSACVISATHFCMVARGVKKQNSVMVTSSLTGNFRQPEVRSEFFRLIGKD